MANDWTVLSLLQTTAKFLAEKGSATARLDAELLLGRVLAMDRVKIYCSFDRPMQAGELDAYREFIRRRAKGEPVAYLLGEKEFYGLPFRVGPEVLIPRPETEHLVDRALELMPKDAPASVIDIGCGSGAICVALATKRPSARFIAVDISEPALTTARTNAERHGVSDRIDFRAGDLFAGATGPFDLIVSNPPYIDHAEKPALPRDVADYEPPTALYADERGLAVIRRIIESSPERLEQGGALLMEIGCTQGGEVAQLLERTGRFAAPRFIMDYSERRRVVEARLR